MNKTVLASWLRDYWLMEKSAMHLYAKIAHDVIVGKTVDVGLFGSLTLPAVPNNVALVTLSGPLTKADICNAQGSRTLALEVAQAANDNSIDAIIILAESCPGGQVDGTEELASAVATAKSKKPVLGVVSGISCSAGYWVQSQCSELYAQSNTDLIGCIGTMGQLKNPKKASAETEEDYISVVSDLSPDKNSEFDDEAKLKAQILNPITSIFHASVTNGRAGKLKLSKENVLTGKTYVAQQALEHGLIDGIMPFNKILNRALFLARKNK